MALVMPVQDMWHIKWYYDHQHVYNHLKLEKSDLWEKNKDAKQHLENPTPTGGGHVALQVDWNSAGAATAVKVGIVI